MEPADLPLLLASDVARSDREIYPLDRIRMQKAVFLATQRGATGWSELYRYAPYDWGPYSRDLANDLDALVFRRTLRTEQLPGSRYSTYRTTASGEERAQSIWDGLTRAQQDFVRRLRRYVTAKSFNHLLREVYAAYPEYATESRFRG